MTNWVNRVLEARNDDINSLVAAMEHFESEYRQGRQDVAITGPVMDLLSKQPSLTEHHFSNQKQLETILEHLNAKLRYLRAKHYRRFNEHYQKSLSQRDIERYIEGEEDVQAMEQLVIRFASLANRYSGIIKALETKGFQLHNIVRLRCAGLDDVVL